VLQTPPLSSDAPPELRASLLALKGEAYISLARAPEANATLEAALALDPHSADALAAMARYAFASGDIVNAQKRLLEAQHEAVKADTLLDLAGDVAFVAQDYAGSIDSYNKMLKAEPWSLAARLGLARAEIALGKTAEAAAHLSAVTKVAPNDAQASYLGALLAYRSNNFALAQARIQPALNVTKNYPPALLLAGASAYALHQYEQANSYLSQYLYQVPQYVQARKLLAGVLIALGRPSDAIKTLSTVEAPDSDDPQILAMIGAASAQIGDFKAADRYLARALEAQPSAAAVRTELGITRLVLGQTEAGIAALEEASLQDPGTLRPEIALFIAYFKQKDFDKALETAKRLEKASPREAVGFDFAGAALLAVANDGAARAEFQRALELHPNDAVATRSLAVIATRAGDVAAATKIYGDMLLINPRDSNASVALAELYEQQGQPAAAVAVLQKAIEQGPENIAPRVSIGRVYLFDQKNQEALDAVAPMLGNPQKDAGVLEVAGQAQLALGNAGDALTSFKALADLQPQSALARHYLAASYLAAGNTSAALVQAEASLADDPHDAIARMLQARAQILTGRYGEARLTLDELAAKYPEDAFIAELQRGTSLERNQADFTYGEFRKALAGSGTGADQTRLAVAQAQAGQIEDAKKTLIEWVTGHPDALGPRQALGDIYLAANELENAQAQYEVVVAAAPNNVAAENNLAWVLSRKGDIRAALDHAQRAAGNAPNAPRVLDTLGVVLLQNQQMAEAVQSLGKAAEAAPGDATIRFHFAQALAGVGDTDKARNLLRTLLADKQPFENREEARSLLQNLGG
jgi:putative PEP-CTERM system TPR-repeat lipoprotein